MNASRLTLLFVILLLAAGVSYAQTSNATINATMINATMNNMTTSNSTSSGPTVVYVGVYVLNVGTFDVSTGTYTVDFYLDLLCNSTCDPSGFEFMNGRATSETLLINSSNELFYRIQASLSTNIDLKDYPFDSHSLPIEMEDQINTADTQVYQYNASDSGVDPAVTLVGWQLTGANATVVNHYYAPYDQTYSRFVYNINIQRIVLASMLKTFLPVVFIVLVGLLALLIEENNMLWTRISIITSALIAAVMFHLNIASSLPPVGYLTFADKFMIVTYISLVLSLLSSILMVMHSKSGEKKEAKRISQIALYVIPIVTILGYALIFIV